MIIKKNSQITIKKLLNQYATWRITTISNEDIKQLEEKVFTKLFVVAIKYAISKYGLSIIVQDSTLEKIATEIYNIMYQNRYNVFTFIKDNTNE